MRRAGSAQPRKLTNDEVLLQLEQTYGPAFLAQISNQTSSLSRRQGPIITDGQGFVDNVGACVELHGYDNLALRALTGLLVLQARRCVVE